MFRRLAAEVVAKKDLLLHVLALEHISGANTSQVQTHTSHLKNALTHAHMLKPRHGNKEDLVLHNLAIYLGLARTVYKRCIYVVFGREITYRTNNISRRKNIVFGGCGELTPPEIYK